MVLFRKIGRTICRSDSKSNTSFIVDIRNALSCLRAENSDYVSRYPVNEHIEGPSLARIPKPISASFNHVFRLPKQLSLIFSLQTIEIVLSIPLHGQARV